jgi:hypothetical protein
MGTVYCVVLVYYIVISILQIPWLLSCKVLSIFTERTTYGSPISFPYKISSLAGGEGETNGRHVSKCLDKIVLPQCESIEAVTGNRETRIFVASYF